MQVLAGSWPTLGAALFSIFFLVGSLYVSRHRLLWYDEIDTAILSMQSWPAGVLRILKTGADQQPFSYYGIVKLSARLFGFSPLALRLPSAVAVSLALVVVYDCVRRLADGLHGLLAMAFLSCSVLPYFGSEARPYALVVFWSACSFWLWVHTRRNSIGAAVLFGIGVLGAVLSHYYAVLSLIPYFVAALIEFPRHPVPRKLIAGSIGAAAALALALLPVINALRGLGHDFWAQPSMAAFDKVFSDLFPHVLLLIAAILAAAAVLSLYRRSGSPVDPMAPEEALGWLFVLLPLVGFIVAKLVTHAFYHRYFIAMLPGIAVAFSCLVRRHFRDRAVLSAAALLLFTATGTKLEIARLLHPEAVSAPQPPGENVKISGLMQFENTLWAEGKQFVVVPPDNPFGLEAVYNSPHPERYRMFLDPQVAFGPMAVLNQVLGAQLHPPLRFWTLEDLKQHRGELAFAGFYDGELLAMENLGLRFRMRIFEPLTVLYGE